MAINKKVWGSRIFWATLGADTKIQYRNFIFDGGKNVYGDDWWGGKYSPQYGERKRGNKFKRQASAYSQDVTAILTSDTFKDFKAYLKVEKNGFEFGFPTMGNRVADLRKRGGKAGTLTSEEKPIPTFLSKFVAKEYHNFIKRNQKDTTRTHTGKGKTKTK